MIILGEVEFTHSDQPERGGISCGGTRILSTAAAQNSIGLLHGKPEAPLYSILLFAAAAHALC
jgi:hypothetical protein